MEDRPGQPYRSRKSTPVAWYLFQCDTMKDYKIIHDAVHGSIKIEDPLLSILETPEMQRMSNVRQLGMNYLVFPGANHTRLEHSLGVSHLAGIIGKNLNLPENEILLLRIAGLLHDVGHAPFSHTLEMYIVEKTGKNHMEIGKEIIKGNLDIVVPDLKERKKIDEILDEYGIDPSDIANMIYPTDNYPQTKLFNENMDEKIYLKRIINGDLDADQLDYLIRDSHYTGVGYGVIDLPRILNTMMLRKGIIVYDKKGIEALESVMVARALMYSSVYFHKTARIAELMLLRAVESAAIDPLELIKMNDSELISALMAEKNYPREMALRIKYRKLFKKVLVLENFSKDVNVRKLEREITETANVPEGYVIIDYPIYQAEPRMNLDAFIFDGNKISSLNETSKIVKSLKLRKPYDYDLMVAAEKNYIENVKKALKKYFSV